MKLKTNPDGEVNRAHYMQQNSSSDHVLIFNYNKLATQNIHYYPELCLREHTKERYGFSCNPNINKHILSASYDQTICLWNIEKPATEGKVVHPLRIFSGHQAVVKV